MPVTIPSAADFKARYPAFASIDDALVGIVLEEGSAAVSDQWMAVDIQPAILAFAAHLLALDGYGGVSVQAGGESIDVAGPVSSIQVGDVKTNFSDQSRVQFSFRDGADGGLSETSYGRRFLELRRRNVIGVITV